jgi:hypothetical protein
MPDLFGACPQSVRPTTRKAAAVLLASLSAARRTTSPLSRDTFVVGEKSDFSTVSLGRAKAGGLVVVTKELAELSSPSAIAVMQRELIKGCAQFLDVQFCDPTVAAVTNVSPGSITNGAATSASAGTSQANAAATDSEIYIFWNALHIAGADVSRDRL